MSSETPSRSGSGSNWTGFLRWRGIARGRGRDSRLVAGASGPSDEGEMCREEGRASEMSIRSRGGEAAAAREVVEGSGRGRERRGAAGRGGPRRGGTRCVKGWRRMSRSERRSELVRGQSRVGVRSRGAKLGGRDARSGEGHAGPGEGRSNRGQSADSRAFERQNEFASKPTSRPIYPSHPERPKSDTLQWPNSINAPDCTL